MALHDNKPSMTEIQKHKQALACNQYAAGLSSTFKRKSLLILATNSGVQRFSPRPFLQRPTTSAGKTITG